MTIAHWRFSQPSAPVTADAVVVGGGVCGISAALAFQRRGLVTHLIERSTVASGASGRNAGFLMRGAADHYADAIRLYGRERAGLVWKWTEENLADLRGEGIEDLPSYRRIPSALLALTDRQADELERSAALLREDGFDAPWLDADAPIDDTVFAGRAGNNLRGALINPHDASINPIHLVCHLAAKLTPPQTTVHEHTPALAIAPGPSGLLTVATPAYTFTTARVLVATNAYAPLLIPSFSSLITPRRGQMLALANAPTSSGARPITLAHSYYANHGSEYLRQTADGSVVIGGCRTYHAEREVGYDDVTTDYVQSAIEGFAAGLLGREFTDLRDAGGIAARWSGVMGFSPDGLPLVGPLPEFPGGGVWFCGGFTGHGMSMGFRTAQAAAAAMLDADAANPFPLSRVRALA